MGKTQTDLNLGVSAELPCLRRTVVRGLAGELAGDYSLAGKQTRLQP